MNENNQFSDIPGFEPWESVELLNKGWSTDKKVHSKNQGRGNASASCCISRRKRNTKLLVNMQSLGLKCQSPLHLVYVIITSMSICC